MSMENPVLMRFVPDWELPIYLKFDSARFEGGLVDFFKRFHFEVVKKDDAEHCSAAIDSDPESRVLEITLASHQVSRFINSSIDTDRFNPETLIPKKGYSLYRVAGMGLMLYSYRVGQWSLGVNPSFGSEEELFKSRLILARFISWALAPLGIVGFWGVPVENGMVVMKQKESLGEPIFVDIRRNEMITFDGIKKLGESFKVVRLDSSLSGRSKPMQPEELLSFLTHHCTYFSESGLSIPVRQVIRRLSSRSSGVLYPRESFKTGSGLSL